MLNIQISVDEYMNANGYVNVNSKYNVLHKMNVKLPMNMQLIANTPNDNDSEYSGLFSSCCSTI